MRRAFLLAGARTVTMSPWRIDDVTTAPWMRALHGTCFVDGRDMPAPVHSARRVVHEARRAAGQSTPPNFRAALIAAGDWR
ncbi:hypothetical protein [Pseudofulvimonas gallinarii]|uniref:hypothetical protein n=1 Tax=Pseudofulvimonas gallinarii TaxID=634155 RepID=UPI0035F0C1A2